jgi:hypothetical protein
MTAGGGHRTVDAIAAAIGQHLSHFTRQEYANYFKNAGDTST